MTRHTEGSWFLAYDSHCGFCSNLSEEISAMSAGTLAVIPLHDPIAQSWREEALGPQAPFAPTLIAVEDKKAIKAWTGTSLIVQLSRIVGPRRAWKIAQLVGDKVRPAEQDEPASGSLLDRRNILKGLAGATASFALLNGVQNQAAAHSPSDCGLVTRDYYVDYYTNASANCRHCPFIHSAIDVTLPAGSLFSTRNLTFAGDSVSGNRIWMRSRGPRGCWIHDSLLTLR
jgi:hypothetical protein